MRELDQWQYEDGACIFMTKMRHLEMLLSVRDRPLEGEVARTSRETKDL